MLNLLALLRFFLCISKFWILDFAAGDYFPDTLNLITFLVLTLLISSIPIQLRAGLNTINSTMLRVRRRSVEFLVFNSIYET